MSEAALYKREAQKNWAEPGSRHDSLIKAAKIGLPSAIGILAAFLLMSPLANRSEVSFILDKNEVDSAPERMRIETARYTGKDDKGQAFVIQANRAVQRSSEEPIVDIMSMFARLYTQSGPATIKADRGRYNLDKQQVAILGPVRVSGPEGERLVTNNVLVDLNRRTVVGGSGSGAGRQGTVSAGEVQGDLDRQQLGLGGGVSGRIRLGQFTAGNVHADLGSRTIVLGGGARLKIEQGTVR